MYYLSKRIHNSTQLTEQERADILKELWQGQCNCPYWHGAFGGLYLKHLRHSIYQHLIEAEVLLEKAEKKDGSWQEIIEQDINLDGHNEVILSNRDQNLYFAPRWGGMLYEWDIKLLRFNLLDTLARREEIYHQKLKNMNIEPQENLEEVVSIHDLVNVKEDGLEDLLFYDWYHRASLLDHFLGWGSDFAAFSKCLYNEEGDFVNQPYETKIETSKKSSKLTMFREGNLWRSENHYPLKVAKTITWDSGKRFNVFYLTISCVAGIGYHFYPVIVF